MIYAIFRKDRIPLLFGQDGHPTKAGRDTPRPDGKKLPGGGVHRTFEDAERKGKWLQARDGFEREVVHVDADWDRDTYQVEGELFRRLLQDARIYRISR